MTDLYGGGDGKQTRSFLYIDECLEGVRRLMDSDTFFGPVNIGSDEMITINQLAEYVMQIAGKNLKIKHIEGPLCVTGRNPVLSRSSESCSEHREESSEEASEGSDYR